MTEVADLQKRVEGIEEKLDRSTADINAKVDSLATASTATNTKVDSLVTASAATNAKVDSTNAKVDSTLAKLDQLIAHINKQSEAAAAQPPADGSAPKNVSIISGVGTTFGPRPNQKDKQKTGEEKEDDGDEDDDEEAYDTASSSRLKRATKSKLKKTKKKESSESEEDDDYNLNDTAFIYDATVVVDDDGTQRHPNYKREPTSLNIKEFNFGESSADWTSWIKKFQGTVRGACNPRDEAEHHKLNLRWLPSYLNTAAHDIFLNCRHRRKPKDWRKLVEELEEAFDDPAIRQRWATDLKAYTWDQKTPLHVYKSNVVHFVNKFESGLRNAPVARKRAYFTRFVGGLPDDYINFIEQQLYGSKQTIEHALQVSQQFKIIKDRTTETKKEVAGAMAPQGNSMNKRIHALEQQMAWLDKELGN